MIVLVKIYRLLKNNFGRGRCKRKGEAERETIFKKRLIAVPRL